MENCLPDVRDQYEHYPFPLRRPEEEAERLIVSEIDRLAKIDHFCFGGRRDFDEPMRILIAGGGTGDALVFLAEQLRGKPCEFVFLDMSLSSLEVARKRAAVRSLENVLWVHDSLLNLDGLGLGTFDYINCVGVLHHLEDPSAGLDQLVSALAEEGGLGIMLYGKYGRRNVYLIQELLGLVGSADANLETRIGTTRRVLSGLARGGVMNADEAGLALIEDPASDPYLVDTYLHGQDRPYSVSDIHELLAGSGLELAGFTNFFDEGGATCALEYDPLLYFTDPGLIERISALPAASREHIAELLGGSISMHAFYATRRATACVASRDTDHAPYFATGYGRDAIRGILRDRVETVPIRLHCGITRSLTVTDARRFALESIGKGMTTRRICQEAGRATSGVGKDRVTAEIYLLLDLLVRLGLVALRSRNLPPPEAHPSPRRWNGAIDLRAISTTETSS